MSYGGSSLVANYLLLAILIRISHAARKPIRTGQYTPIAAARTEVFGRT
jgi:cell division protein FtsW (lipid II flippase)